MADKQRIQFDFSPAQLELFEEIENKTGAISKAEIVRRAVKFYAYFVSLNPEAMLSITEEDKTILTAPIKLLL